MKLFELLRDAFETGKDGGDVQARYNFTDSITLEDLKRTTTDWGQYYKENTKIIEAYCELPDMLNRLLNSVGGEYLNAKEDARQLLDKINSIKS